MEPLAQRLRPRTLDEVCGQQHLLGKNQVFRRTVESGKIPNMIFYGPSGVGKTTVASIIAAGSGMQLHKLNGTTASTSDIKSVLADIGTLGASGGILLYLDEIQYFNKRQQQSLLECVEQGTVTLIASTTENPYFYVYNALLSRCTVFEFKSLTTDDIRTGLRSAAARLGAEDKSPVLIPDDALEYLAQSAGGDMRKALGNLEFAVTAAPVENGSRTITSSETPSPGKSTPSQQGPPASSTALGHCLNCSTNRCPPRGALNSGTGSLPSSCSYTWPIWSYEVNSTSVCPWAAQMSCPIWRATRSWEVFFFCLPGDRGGNTSRLLCG